MSDPEKPYAGLRGSTRVVGVIGWPVERSLSPAIHNAAFAALGMDWTYVPMPVAPGRLPVAVQELRALGFAGANVTMPHKTGCAELLEDLSEDARVLSAVNTIVVGAETTVGHNTDAPGFERFLRLDGRHVETRPIKGTRPRGRDASEDRVLARDLLCSAKDRAENVMIVDVLRNDLGRVCRPGTVRVPRLCRLERTATVQHLVSTVTGELAEGRDAFDLLAASFPGGSITGAPKIRAMEILEGLEPVRRGPYTGAIGWVGPDGAMQTSIVIRTFVADGRSLTLHVGGGITWKSDPAAEWEETVTKARGPLGAIGARETG